MNRRARSSANIESEACRKLREGRPEHLTVEAAIQHAEMLRPELDRATVVGRLLVVAVDELQRFRDREPFVQALVVAVDKIHPMEGAAYDWERQSCDGLDWATECARRVFNRSVRHL